MAQRGRACEQAGLVPQTGSRLPEIRPTSGRMHPSYSRSAARPAWQVCLSPELVVDLRITGCRT